MSSPTVMAHPLGNNASYPAAREFPTIQGTEEGDRTLREAMVRFPEQSMAERVMPAPLATQGARDGVNLLSKLEYFTLDHVKSTMREHLIYAIYALGATDEQVMAACALHEAIGYSVLSMAGPIASKYLVLASLLEGSENSTLLRSIAGAMHSLSSEELVNEWEQVRHGILGLVEDEVAHHVKPGIEIRLPDITWVRTGTSKQCVPALNDPRALRVQALSTVGESYLHALAGGWKTPLREYILSRSEGMSNDELNAVEMGARALYLDPILGRKNKPNLPLGLLERLPTMDPRILGEFHALVEEYNLEWALASYDWSGGESEN